jgi:hypothetical protein
VGGGRCWAGAFARGVSPTAVEGATSTTIQLLVSRSGLLRDPRPQSQCAVLPDSSPDRIRSARLLSTLLVERLLLSPLIAHDALIRSIPTPPIRPCCGSWLRSWLRLRHTLLATMLAALILRTFQVVFSGHRDHTFSFNCVFPPNKRKLFRAFSWPTMRSSLSGSTGYVGSTTKPADHRNLHLRGRITYPGQEDSHATRTIGVRPMAPRPDRRDCFSIAD